MSEALMARSQSSVIDPLRMAQEVIDNAVTDFRNRGFTREHATEQAALALGIKTSRAKALLYGQAFKVTTDELTSLRRQFLAHLDAQYEYLSAKLAAIKARHAQLELDI